MNKRYLLATLIICVVLLLPSLQEAYGRAEAVNPVDYKSLVNMIDREAILEHIKYFSSLGSRMSGSPGCNAAADYIYNYLKSLGLEVWYQDFMVTVPVNYGAKVVILSPFP